MSATGTENSEWALGDVEPTLLKLRANIKILGHLVHSKNEVSADEWCAIEDQLLWCHDELETLWSQAFEHQNATYLEHKAALAAAEAKKAAPGSEADIKHVMTLWRVLRTMAAGALEQCDEALGPKAQLKDDVQFGDFRHSGRNEHGFGT